jgi:hypothetical protein
MALVKHNNNSISNLTSVNLPQGKMTLISEQTASGSASISFTSGIDSTYPIYKFEFININPANDGGAFTFNMSTDGGSNYNVTKTTTMFHSFHSENDSETLFGYLSSYDQAQSTDFAFLAENTGNESDECLSGSMTLFNPSSSVFVKHFISNCNTNSAQSDCRQWFVAGYGNISTPVNSIQFKINSGNFDGTIKLYGIGD